MPCALCLLTKPLMSSHVVPEFLYREMYDLKHRFLALSTLASDRPRHYQKGLREDLLCADCEQLLGRFESYASQVFYGKGAPKTQRQDRMLIIEGLDYSRMKLFLLSLLWRFGVTKLAVFKGARLGSHAEKLRRMLLAEHPGDPLAYPCLLTAVTWKTKHIGDFIAPPCLAKMDGHHIWSFVVAGIIFTFFVSSHVPIEVPPPAFLQENGTLIIMRKEITEIDFLHRFASEVADAQRKEITSRSSCRMKVALSVRPIAPLG